MGKENSKMERCYDVSSGKKAAFKIARVALHPVVPAGVSDFPLSLFTLPVRTMKSLVTLKLECRARSRLHGKHCLYFFVEK